MNQATLRCTLSAIALACLSGAAQADEAFTYSGFASFVAGRVIAGDRTEPLNSYTCPCFIADYGHGALYAPHWSVKQESKVGLQGTYTFTPALSGTVQVVGRGVDGVKASLEWAYLSYDLSPSWTIQVGRKRLPIYYYSDFQDVGYAYTWVRPPADIYGWEVTNYNGVNATYRTELAGWAVKSNLFGGGEYVKESLMQRIYYETPQRLAWRNIVGGDLVFSKDWLTTRATYIQSHVQQWDRTDGSMVTPDPGTHPDVRYEKQKIYGISANIDIDNWFVRSEYSIFDRSGYSYKSRAYMIGAGARLGKFTPMITHTRYKERNDFFPDEIQHDKGWSATLRYELTDSIALKAQYDLFKDHSGMDYVKDSKLVSFSLDTVF
ncbi:MAG: hypothetical protein QM742_16430 [Aquabacterium sp.]